jgi:hypothetical protein
MNQSLLDAIRNLVADLSGGRFEELEADGRGGRLTAAELRSAIHDYGRTLVPLPDEAASMIDIHPNQVNPKNCFLDVPLWTAEEGRSDLTLSLVAIEEGNDYRLEISDLHVL